ncbi:MAG: PQQ-binding-like beta-propeller repeat protein [bacterium]|nr:PQQ-binding-like beta-propeller repeat protein [bacterium]
MRRSPFRGQLPTATLAAVLAVALATTAAANDWPQFRGLNRDGTSAETGLLHDWPEAGPTELWRIPIGEGYSASSIVDDRLYTMYAGEEDGKPVEYAVVFDAGTGNEIWKTLVGDKLDTEFGNGPRSTPTVVDDTVYVLGSRGDLAALDAAEGTINWRLDLTETFGGSMPNWGFATSILVDQGKVIVEGGGPEGKSYSGLDASTGEVLWSTGEARGAGYNSPLAVDMNGERRYVYIAGGQLRCIDEDGKEIWQHEWPRGETHAMPVLVSDNRIYASGAQGVGAQLVEVREGDDGASVAEVWKAPHLRNHFSSAVAHEGTIYGFDNATLKAVSADTGELAWAKRGLGKGSLILADGHLFVLSDRGRLLQIKATPEAYTEEGSVQALSGKTWTAPSLANGILYLRSHSELVAYDLRHGGSS